MVRIIHYVNQFFGQIGGEEKAGVAPTVTDGPVGPGLLIERILQGEGSVVATVICGDNYFAENTEAASEEVMGLLHSREADLFVAGPAFNAGRYGIACGEMCRAVRERMGLPAVTGMYPENPGVDLYRKNVTIVATTNNAAGMGKAMPTIIRLGLKLLRNEPIGRPEEEGYIPHGVKSNTIVDKLAAERAIEMLLRKMQGLPYRTEIPFPDLDTVAPAPPVAELRTSTIALVTEGGLVPLDNPDNIESARATRWGKYPVEELLRLGREKYQSIHRGIDTTFINEEPNRLLPVDVLTEMEGEGIFGRLFPHYFVTTGVATTMESARRIGKAIADELRSGGVSGVILTST